MGMQKGGQIFIVIIKGLINFIRAQSNREWQIAACQSFGQAHQIRRDAGLFAGEQGAGASESGGDLIDDQMHIKFITGRA